MDKDLMNLSYNANGSSTPFNIRTLYDEGILYISLKDTLLTLNRENKEIDSSHKIKSMTSILKAQLESLEEDEYIRVPVKKPHFKGETEVFINQPGLYRVLSSDKSLAGKKFQNWLYKEVVPSLAKFGVYPPPEDEVEQDEDIALAKLLADNSKLLLNTMQKQKLLEKRVEKLEKSNGENQEPFYLTVIERLNQLNIVNYCNDRVTHIVAWCENLVGKTSFTLKKCASGNRLNTLFPRTIIDEAIELDKSTWK